MITSRSSTNVFRLVLIAAAVAVAACSAFRTSQRTFNTPDDAVKALVDAAKAGDLSEIVKIFGTDSKDLLDTSDPATAKQNSSHANDVGWRSSKRLNTNKGTSTSGM